MPSYVRLELVQKLNFWRCHRWSIQMLAHQALGDLTVSPADKTYTVGLVARAAAYRRHAAGMAGAGDGRDCVSVLQDGMVRGAMQ